MYRMYGSAHTLFVMQGPCASIMERHEVVEVPMFTKPFGFPSYLEAGKQGQVIAGMSMNWENVIRQYLRAIRHSTEQDKITNQEILR